VALYFGESTLINGYEDKYVPHVKNCAVLEMIVSNPHSILFSVKGGKPKCDHGTPLFKNV
jgi:hypothetical protein